MAENTDATFEHVIEGPNGQAVQFCSLEERKLAQETAQKEREEQCKKNVLLDVNHLDVTLFTEDGALPAVSDLSFIMRKGETLAVVGESGCGKSTTGKCVLRLTEPTSGTVELDGEDFTSLKGEDLKRARQKMKLIFQDPYSSLNPRMTVMDIIGEPIDIAGTYKTKAERDARIEEVMEEVGLNLEFKYRYPHEFSGGQRQRIGIARALAVNPKLVVLDEPVSALDVSVQAGVINLLEELRASLGLSYLMVAHDLAVIRHASDRVAVMYLGRIVEIGHVDQVFDNPIHPYTKALLSAIPVPDPEVEAKRQRIMLDGDLPTPVNAPVGCGFSSRCPIFKLLPEDKQKRCLEEKPEVITLDGEDHGYACYYPDGADLPDVALESVS